MQPIPLEQIFSVFSFILGAAIGSFLNVCIYRMPLNLSVNNPKRSFCPNCKNQIPWYQNLPLFSWLWLRGRCSKCQQKISIRYFGVELLTGLLFLAIWKHVAGGVWVLAFPYWILASLFIVATFIDFDYFIIPDEITWGGTIAGILLSFAIPQMMGTESFLFSGLWSILGAAVGYFTLWTVVQLGKKAFGKKKLSFTENERFSWTYTKDDAELQFGQTKELWSEMFSRDSDKLLMRALWAEIGGERFEKVLLEFNYERLQIGERSWDLNKVATITGEISEIIIPREAMGLGDVKFIAAIGAFLGWKAVFFTIFSASVLGATIGLLTVVLGKREWSAKIPFGPYLALGALIWLFSGPALLHWYFQLIAPPSL